MSRPRQMTIGNYSKSLDEAMAKLRLAITYGEDGACYDAARCASEGVVKLFEAASIRMRVLEAQQKGAV